MQPGYFVLGRLLMHRGSVMADDSKQSFPNLGGNGFVWILLVAAGTLFVARQTPLEGSRPPSAERLIPQQAGTPDVDARLWQDPFAAVADQLAKSPDLRSESCPDEKNDHCQSPLNQSDPVPAGRVSQSRRLVLVVPVTGAPYSEDREWRRRTRYAVLAGLNAEGFVPQDPQHIKFYRSRTTSSSPPLAVQVELPLTAAPQAPFTMPVDDPLAQQRRAPLAFQVQIPLTIRVQAPAAPVPKTKLPEVIPYEWFVPRSAGETLPYDRVLLLWFDEDALHASSPLDQFTELLCPTSPIPAYWDKAAILGPQSSTTLRAMVDDAVKKAKAGKTGEKRIDEVSKKTAADLIDTKTWEGICPGRPRPQFYVHSATADDTTLLPDHIARLPCRQPETCLSDFFDTKKISLHRMIATDEALARTIRDELRRRHVEVDSPTRRSHIALISEWDTVYGRALPASMARCLGGEPNQCQGTDADPFTNKPWLHPFKYLRGLDGQMPNGSGLNSGDNAKDADIKRDRDNKDSTKNQGDPKGQDRAEGQGQFDYLRRLGERIRQLDTELRAENPNGIEAVGILGSDLYDKLLVLQALRPLLPNALFFTTDLDALLQNPVGPTSTRNLLVASSFGLELRPAIQGEIPPFRSSYQTASFLATRVAIRSAEGPSQVWPMSPLLFEIGKSRPFQFANNGSAPLATSENRRPDSPECRKGLLKCTDIHPLPSTMVPPLDLPLAMGFAAVALCLPLSFRAVRRRTCNRVDKFMERAKNKTNLATRVATALAVLLAVLLGVGTVIRLLWPILADQLTAGGEPLTLLEGISVWPTILLRMATLLLCIWFIIHGWQRLNSNMKEIAGYLHLEHARKSVNDDEDERARTRPWIGLVNRFWYRFPDDDSVLRADSNVARLWRMYHYQGRWTARFVRVAAGLVAMSLLWWILVSVFGNPSPPTRGPVSSEVYRWVTIALVFATMFLIFFVADTTSLCWRLVRSFRSETTNWPPETRRVFAGQGLPTPVLDDWIDLRFVSERTKCITTLIYYPFLIIALLVVSRSRLFANYGTSVPILVSMGTSVLIVTVCAVALRWSAEASRAKARQRLIDLIVAARRSATGGRRADQLEAQLRRVEDLREGAFSPFSQQPLVRAMLLPLGGFGGTALLEYLTVPGLS